ncbi:MAG: DUF4340 domain-containing protein [Myxococcota bacterium]|jgi:Domain of unknown function (DUF4340)|nr:DUF4340 domain-containing protein [Myxococcota bacterium]
MKGLTIHVALLALASAAALKIWTRDAEQDKTAAAEVSVWSAPAESVEHVVLETKSRKVVIEPKKDAVGRYYVLRVEKDAGDPAGDGDEPPKHPEPPKGPLKQETLAFVGVKSADETVGKLAKLSAVRALGKLDPARAADFGLDKPEGTLKIKISGKEHVLTIGANTPGASERYAKYGASGEVFAISGEIMQSLQFADSRLMERELHAYEPEEVTRIRVTRGGKSRELVRIAGKQDAWADAATPTKPDESFGNWNTKLARVRITDYVEKPAVAPTPANQSVRVEYFAGSKSLGFLELYKLPGGSEGNEYLAKSEQTRWYAKVLGSAAEQADQDSANLFK